MEIIENEQAASEVSAEIVVENKERQEVDRAIELTKKFVDKLYGGDVPERIKNRFEKVSSAITVSTDELNKYLTNKGVTELGTTIRNGVYTGDEDKIILREGTSLSVKIHEICHFLSSDPATNKTGLKETEKGFFLEGDLFNEVVTIFISAYAESGLDASNRSDFLGAKRVVRDQKNTTGSYSGSSENFANMVSGFNEWGGVRTGDRRLLGIVPDIFKNYFDGDKIKLREKFKDTLGDDNFDLFVKNIEKAGMNDLVKVINVIDIYAENSIKEGHFQGEEVVLVRNFVDAVKNDNTTKVVYPENCPSYCRISQRMEFLGQTIEPIIELNAEFRQVYDDPSDREKYLKMAQFKAWIMWQSIVYDEAKRGNALGADEFFSNETMKLYLSRSDVAALMEISRMAKILVGVKKR